MKPETLTEALNSIQDEYILEAGKRRTHTAADNPGKEKYTVKVTESKGRIWRWAGAVAASLAAVIALGCVLWRNALPAPEAPLSLHASNPTSPSVPTQPPVTTLAPTQPPLVQSPVVQAIGLVASPEYPHMVQIPDINVENYWDAYDAWRASLAKQYDQPSSYAVGLDGFFMGSASAFLSDSNKNQVYSPANVYMALAMLAETTGGETQQEILALLNAKDTESLREQAGHLWNAHYCDDGGTKLLLANSLWLDQELSYHAHTAATLAKDYYASVFHGDIGTEEMNQSLRSWIDQNTGGLLRNYTASLELDKNTKLALASTIHYQVKWDICFNEALTREGIFHSPQGEQTVEYMYSSFSATIEEDSDCSWVSIPLKDGCQMRLILPKEGYTPQDILASDHVKRKLSGQTVYSRVPSVVNVNLQLPKFDVTAETDLRDGLQNMGITKAFSPTEADFSGITDEALYLSKADHAARVKIDEEGIEAAAYTIMVTFGTGAPIEREEVDFIVDRPFLFVIEGRNNVPLFIGVVNDP